MLAAGRPFVRTKYSGSIMVFPKYSKHTRTLLSSVDGETTILKLFQQYITVNGYRILLEDMGYHYGLAT